MIVDAVGATKSKKTDSRPLERKPSVPLKDLLGAVTMGVQDEDLFTSLANRLIRLEKQLTTDEKAKYEDLTGGKTINQTAKDLLNAYDPDLLEGTTQQYIDALPEQERSEEDKEECRRKAQNDLAIHAAKTFTGEINEYLENVRKVHEQIIDTINIDKVTRSEWDSFTREKAEDLVNNFKAYIEANKDEITALRIFYDQPYLRREITFKMIKELLEKLKLEKPLLAPQYVWEAYAQLEEVKSNSPKNELTALVSLVRRVTGIDESITPYSKTVDQNFQRWVFQQNAGQHNKFSEAQMDWLRMIKDHIATSFHLDVEDLGFTPFDAQGGVGKMYELFGDQMNEIISELNEELAA